MTVTSIKYANPKRSNRKLQGDFTVSETISVTHLGRDVMKLNGRTIKGQTIHDHCQTALAQPPLSTLLKSSSQCPLK
jgi:hypothetical protein